MTPIRALLPVVVLLSLGAPAGRAEPTHLDVRVLSKGAKFVGTSMGGAEVVVRDVTTGEVLARGLTAGSTGDTVRIMKASSVHHAPIATDGTAVFSATLDLDEPCQVEVSARGPLAQPQAINTVSATQWIVPGKHVTGGDGLRLELPGFVVDVLAPPAHVKLPSDTKSMEVRANVTMMCGCPIEPGGLWDAEGYEVELWLKRDGETIGRQALRFAGQTSQFAGTVELAGRGAYEAIVIAHDPRNGNTGLDRTTWIVK